MLPFLFLCLDRRFLPLNAVHVTGATATGTAALGNDLRCEGQLDGPGNPIFWHQGWVLLEGGSFRGHKK